MFINLVFWFFSLSLPLFCGFQGPGYWEQANEGQGGPRSCSSKLCSLISWTAGTMQVVCILGKCLWKCSGRRKGNLSIKPIAVWGADASDWHSRMYLSYKKTSDLESQVLVVENWKDPI